VANVSAFRSSALSEAARASGPVYDVVVSVLVSIPPFIASKLNRVYAQTVNHLSISQVVVSFKHSAAFHSAAFRIQRVFFKP
jgi:hypothetical protein